MPRKIKVPLAKLERLARQGKTQKQIAEELGMAYQTLLGKLQDDPEVRAAYDRGRRAAPSAPDDAEADDEGREEPARAEEFPAVASPSKEMALARVKEVLRGGPMCRRQLVDATGLKRFEVYDAVDALCLDGDITKHENRAGIEYLRLAGDTTPIPEAFDADKPPPPAPVARPATPAAEEPKEEPEQEATQDDGGIVLLDKSNPVRVAGAGVELSGVEDSIRGLSVERAYLEYHGFPSPTMSAVLAKVASTLEGVRVGAAE